MPFRIFYTPCVSWIAEERARGSGFRIVDPASLYAASCRVDPASLYAASCRVDPASLYAASCRVDFLPTMPGYVPIEDLIFAMPTDFTILYEWAACGGDINVRDDVFGMSLLHIALYNGHVELTEWLLQFRALDVNAVNHVGRTALEQAMHFTQLKSTDAWLLMVRDPRFKPTGYEIVHACQSTQRLMALGFVREHMFFMRDS